MRERQGKPAESETQRRTLIFRACAVRRLSVFQSFRGYKMEKDVSARLVNTPVAEAVDVEDHDFRIEEFLHVPDHIPDALEIVFCEATI